MFIWLNIFCLQDIILKMNTASLVLENADLLQQIGLLLWAKTGDSALAGRLAALRVGYEVYERLSGEREMEALRSQTILTIAKWIKDHPKASNKEVADEIEQQIALFARKVENM